MHLRFIWLVSVLASSGRERLTKQELSFVGQAIDDFIGDFDRSIQKKNHQLLRMLGKMAVRSVEGEASAHELIESWMKGMKAAFEARLMSVTEDLKERVLIECVDAPDRSSSRRRHLGSDSDSVSTDLEDSNDLGGQCFLRKPQATGDPLAGKPRGARYRLVPGTRTRERIVIRDQAPDLLGAARTYTDVYDDYRGTGWRHLDEVDDYPARGSRYRTNRYDDLYRKRELEREREVMRLEARLSRLRRSTRYDKSK